MVKVFKIVLMCIFFLTAPVLAETLHTRAEKIDITFEQAYQLMLNNNNMLKSLSMTKLQSKYEKNAAIGEYFPKVGLNATYIHFANPISVTTDMSRYHMPNIDTLIQDENVIALGGCAWWNIFTGGKILALNAAARAKLEATNFKYAQMQDTLTVDLVKKYYGLALSREVVEVKRQYMEDVKKHLIDAKALEREGFISKSERLHAQVAYDEALRDYKASKRDTLVVEEALKSLIKEDSVNLKNVEIVPLSALFLFEDSSINLNEMRENALKNNPQINQLRAKRKVMQAKYKGEIANYFPTVSLFGADILAASDLSAQVPRWAVGGTANLVLFDGFSRYNKVKAADAGRKSVDYEILEAQYNIETLIYSQYQELMKNKELFESTESSLKDAKEALRTATLGFKEGIKTSLDVTDAQIRLEKVKLERLQALYNYDLALARMLQTNGNTKDILIYSQGTKTEIK